MNDRTAPFAQNPLLNFDDLPLFDAITPALVGPAIDELMQAVGSGLAEQSPYMGPDGVFGNVECFCDAFWRCAVQKLRQHVGLGTGELEGSRKDCD